MSPRKKKRRFEVIDQQWVSEKEDADRIVNMLRRAAASNKLVIGLRPDGDGWTITVEELVEDDDD